MHKQDDIFLFLVTNTEFVRWVKSPNPELDTYWKNWMLAHPESLAEVKRAKEMISGLRQKTLPANASAKTRVLQTILASESIPVQKIPPKSVSRTKTPFWFCLDQWTKVAAILLLTLLSTFLLYKMTFVSPAPIEVPSQTPLISKVTRFGEKLTIKLPDGSTAWLNSGSELKFPERFDSLERRVMLSGEGYFEVSHDSIRTFRVVTGNIITEALGTSFAVNEEIETGKLEISLVSGKVKVNDKSRDEFVILSPGEQLRYRDSSQGMEVGTFSAEKVLGWRDGILQFSNAGFEEVIRKLERWYGVQIAVSGRPGTSWQLSGRYANQHLDLVLNRMSYIESFSYKINGKNVQLKF